MDDDSQQAQEKELKYWLALLRAPGLGSRGIIRLLQKLGEPSRILVQINDRSNDLGLPPEAQSYLRSPDWRAIDGDIQWLQHPGHHLITLADPRYPELLTQTADPPPLLFVRGNPDLLNSPQLAIVGSRNPTASGRQTARDFACFLATAGITITSGLAIGIDGASHEGALAACGHTIAVTATGPDRLYPARHQHLAERILEQGALITEFLPGTPAKPGHFPRRNRLISGLSLGTLVVEAAKQSGSLITARLAAEQGREVFAIPGSIHNPLARGCHDLIRQGAKLVESARDVVEELGPLLGHMQLPHQPEQKRDADESESWDQDYRRLLDCLGFDSAPMDLLIQRSGLTADAVSSMLLLLELEGYVSSAPGGRYCLTGKRRHDPPSQEPVS